MTAHPFTRCRSVGHSWDPIPTTKRPEFGALILLRCEHCGTHKRWIISPTTGAILSRSYVYPDGYRDAGDDRWTRAEWRTDYLDALGDLVGLPDPLDGTAAGALARRRLMRIVPREATG